MEKFKIITKNKLSELPKNSGVYCFLSGKETIYIGKAINIQNRVKNHFQQPSYRDNLFMDKVSKVGFFETNSEIEALILEANLIKKHQPKFNVVWKDDKNYFYVAIAKNKQKIPYVYITHQPNQQLTTNRLTANKKNPELDVRSYKLEVTNVGPFVEGTALKMTLRFLRKVFPYYTQAKHPKNKCMWCHLGLCPGPRLFEARLAPAGAANPNLLEYRRNIKKLILILHGEKTSVISSLKKEMADFSKQNKFEEAGVIRDRIYNLQQVMAHADVIESSKLKVESLKLRLSGRVECYDVSNIQGKQATGSMVVFVNGKPDKNQYRKFKIKIENTPNDIAMLKETLERRFLHKEWKFPEVILIDGGKAQLNVAINAKNQKTETKNIKVISIAKRNKDLYIEGRDDFIPLKNLPQEIYNLILQLDDEAHRFAITYHKKLRKNELLK